MVSVPPYAAKAGIQQANPLAVQESSKLAHLLAKQPGKTGHMALMTYRSAPARRESK